MRAPSTGSDPRVGRRPSTFPPPWDAPRPRRTANALGILGLLAAGGCGFGTAAVVSASSSGGDGTTPQSVASSLFVPRSATSPASIFFVHTNQTGTPADVEILFREGGGARRPIRLAPGSAPLTRVPSSPTAYEVLWDFAADLGDERFRDGIEVELRVKGGISPLPATNVQQGNDPPSLSLASMPPEVSGIAALRFTVADSSSDPVDVRVEFATDAVPQLQVARPAGIEPLVPSPSLAFTQAASAPNGVAHTFFWDTATPASAAQLPGDLVGLDVPTQVRITATDAFGGTVSAVFALRVDNDSVPLADLGDEFLVNPDDRRGIPVPVGITDDGDQVRVLLQWRSDDQAGFPPLTTSDATGPGGPPVTSDPDELAEWCKDPAFLRARQICLPFPAFATGTCVPRAVDRLRIEELANRAARVLNLGIADQHIELMRQRRFQPLAASWTTNPTNAPVAVRPLGDGISALVLDGPNGNARLVELDLARGTITRVLAQNLTGSPTALAVDPAEREALVATDAGGVWRLFAVRLDQQPATALEVLTGSSAPQGPLRSLLVLGAGTAAATAEDSVWRLRWAPGAAVARLTGGLATPTGLAADPLRNRRILVAERDANRIVSYGLDDDTRFVLPATGTGIPLRSPSSLAIESTGNGTRLLALCTTVNPSVRELRAVDLGHPPAPAVTTIAAVAGDAASIGVGPAGLVVVALPASSDIVAHGGIEQRRAIAGYDPLTRELTLDQPASPPARQGQEWRIPLGLSVFGRADGTTSPFVWDTKSLGFGDRVHLRAIVADTEFGVSDATSVARAIRNFDTATWTVGAGPVAPSAADIDGDGSIDFVCANQLARTLTVHFHESTGPRAFVAASLDPQAAVDDLLVATAIADFDGDGDQDIACLAASLNAAQPAGKLRVFAQTAPRTFQLAAQTVATTPIPTAMVAADFDNDGRCDLATAQLVDRTITFHRQVAGAGPTFVSTPSAPFDQAITGMATGDIDGDGRIELVALGGATPDSIVRVATLAAGSIQVTETTGVAAAPGRIAAADLDADGDLDFVCADPSRNELRVLTRTPAGIQAGPVLVTGTGPGAVLAADFDGDADLDVACANEGAGSISLFQQSQVGGFVAQEPIDLGGITGIAAADLDGDRRLDLLTTGTVGGLPAVTTLFADATRSPIPATPVVAGSGPNFLVTADLDGDGDLDLATANAGGASVGILTQAATREFALAQSLATDTTIPASVTANDLDGDGDVDLIACNKGQGANLGNVTVLANQGDGTFVHLAPLTAGARPTNAAIADFDGDGDIDLVVVNEVSDDASIFLQTGPLEFTLSATHAAGDRPEFVATADVDGDGRADFVTSNRAANTLTLFRQTGPMAFAPTTLNVGLFPANVEIVDIDDDGDLDLVCANEDATSVSILLRSSTGTFGPLPPLTTDGGPTSIRAVDLDGDGDLDLATSNKNGTLTLLMQDTPAAPGGPLFVRLPPVTVGGEAIGLAAGDLDGDGDVDLAAALRTLNTVRICYGRSR